MRHIGNGAHLLHIRPWEWDLLSVEQEDAVLFWLDDYQRQAEAAAAEMEN